MAQPYDLSGIAALDATVNLMLADQDFGTYLVAGQDGGNITFAGSEQSWISFPTGWFNAVLTTGGNPSPTTADQVRNALKTIRTLFDVIAGGTGSAAALAVQAATPPSLLLETGRSPTGPQTAFGPIMNAAQYVAGSSYDLSGIASLTATANAMLADALSRVTVFTGWGETWKPNPQGQFQAILTPNGSPQTATMGTVRPVFAAVRAKFDKLGITRTPPGFFILDKSLLDGPDVLA